MLTSSSHMTVDVSPPTLLQNRWKSSRYNCNHSGHKRRENETKQNRDARTHMNVWSVSVNVF